jgi:hypothetical protein
MLNETMKKAIVWLIVIGMVLSLTIGLLAMLTSS